MPDPNLPPKEPQPQPSQPQPQPQPQPFQQSQPFEVPINDPANPDPNFNPSSFDPHPDPKPPLFGRPAVPSNVADPHAEPAPKVNPDDDVNRDKNDRRGRNALHAEYDGNPPTAKQLLARGFHRGQQVSVGINASQAPIWQVTAAGVVPPGFTAHSGEGFTDEGLIA